MSDPTLASYATTQPDSLEGALLKRVESGQIELPLLPDVAWRVMEMSQSDDVDIKQISEVVHRDPALATHMLRVANSPAYMSRMPIVSLQQAIGRLGIRQMSEIVFAVSVQSRLFEAPGHEEEIQMLWTHSVSTGVYASAVARLLGRNIDGAFLCGLLHDIGKAVILQMLVDIENEEGSMLLPSALDDLVESLHQQVGGFLARQWSLPDYVSESILLHHSNPPPADSPELVLVTQLADSLSYHMMNPELVDKESLMNHPVLPNLNLYPEDVGELIEQQDRIRKVVESMS